MFFPIVCFVTFFVYRDFKQFRFGAACSSHTRKSAILLHVYEKSGFLTSGFKMAARNFLKTTLVWLLSELRYMKRLSFSSVMISHVTSSATTERILVCRKSFTRVQTASRVLVTSAEGAAS
jgi:hypothetical protein